MLCGTYSVCALSMEVLAWLLLHMQCSVHRCTSYPHLLHAGRGAMVLLCQAAVVAGVSGDACIPAGYQLVQ